MRGVWVGDGGGVGWHTLELEGVLWVRILAIFQEFCRDVTVGRNWVKDA